MSIMHLEIYFVAKVNRKSIKNHSYQNGKFQVACVLEAKFLQVCLLHAHASKFCHFHMNSIKILQKLIENFLLQSLVIAHGNLVLHSKQ
jgi:hypothetical protein